MITCQHTPMVFFDIFSPRYHDNKVLLKDQKIGVHNKIVFSKAPSMGNKPYYISGAKTSKFPTELMETRDGRKIKMRVIPTDDLDDLEIKHGCVHLV